MQDIYSYDIPKATNWGNICVDNWQATLYIYITVVYFVVDIGRFCH